MDDASGGACREPPIARTANSPLRGFITHRRFGISAPTAFLCSDARVSQCGGSLTTALSTCAEDAPSQIRGARPQRAPRDAGFTLLEVLIALLILSLVLVALIRAAGLQAQALMHHRDSTLAQWVAANVAADLRVQGAPAVGRQQGEARMGPQRWRWQAETSDTDVERLRRIEITVFPVGADALAGPAGDPVARLTAFATP